MVLALWTREGVRVPRGRAELLGRDMSALLLVHGDGDSRFEDFACETATSLKKKREGRGGSSFLKT